MKTITLLIISLVSFVATLAHASDLVFVKIPGMPGNSEYDGHAGEILATEFQHTVDRSNIVAPGLVSITKRIDRASPALAKAAGTTQLLPSITVTVRRSGATGMDYYIIVMEGVSVSSFDQVGKGDVVMESVSFSAAKLTYTLIQQSAKGEPQQPITDSVAFGKH